MIKSEQEKNEHHHDASPPIVDTRFQSFARVYIYDLLNSEPIVLDQNGVGQNRKGIVKINEMYSQKVRTLFHIFFNMIIIILSWVVLKVAICGTIVSVYDAEKYFRLKIDDSTGVIYATLWRNTIMNDANELGLCSKKLLEQAGSSASQMRAFNELKPKEVYDTLDAIRRELKDPRVNHSVMYEPKQGDLVLVKATLNHYK